MKSQVSTNDNCLNVNILPGLTNKEFAKKQTKKNKEKVCYDPPQVIYQTARSHGPMHVVLPLLLGFPFNLNC